MKSGDSRSPGGVGYLPLQHRNYNRDGGGREPWTVDMRSSILAYRILTRDDPPHGIGQWIYEDGSVGDVHGGQLLYNNGKRPIPMWRFATPAITSTDVESTGDSNGTCAILSSKDEGLLPIYDKDYSPDVRFKRIDLNVPKKDGKAIYPKPTIDSIGISLIGNREDDQHDLFFPTDPRLIAVNRKGDIAMGSMVCDMGDGFKVDPTRVARLQSAFRIVKSPTYCATASTTDESKSVIAWQIGPSGCGDTRGGYVFEKRGGLPSASQIGSRSKGSPGTIALVSKEDSGFLFVGDPAADVHQIGKDADGHSINAGHIHTNAYFYKDLVRDGPIEFSDDLYIQPQEGQFLLKTEIRWDENGFHPFVCGPKPGRWRLETLSPIGYIPPESGKIDIATIDRTKVPTQGPPPVPTGPDQPSIPPTPPDNQPQQADNPTIRFPGGIDFGFPGGIRFLDFQNVRQWIPGNPTQGFPATYQPLAAPAFLFRPQDITRNVPDLRISNRQLPVELVRYTNRAWPITGRLEAFGKTTAGNNWGYGQSPGKGRFPCGTGPGGFALMPPEFDMTDASSSFSRAGITPSTTYGIAVPGAYWGAAIPDTTTGALKTGYRWGTDSSGNLNIDKIDSSGNITSQVGQWDSNGQLSIAVGTGTGRSRVKGTLDVQTTAIGNVGTGEDDLMSYNLPANSLSDSNKTVHIVAYGETSSGSVHRTIKFHWGNGTSITLYDVTESTARSWKVDICITRTSSGNQDIHYILATGADGTTAPAGGNVIDSTTGAETDTAQITFKFTGEATNNDDVVQEYMLTEFYN